MSLEVCKEHWKGHAAEFCKYVGVGRAWGPVDPCTDTHRAEEAIALKFLPLP